MGTIKLKELPRQSLKVVVDKEKSSLQSKINRQQKELTRLYKEAQGRKAAIKHLCKVRDEAKHLYMFAKGMGLDSLCPYEFDLIEKELLSTFEDRFGS